MLLAARHDKDSKHQIWYHCIVYTLTALNIHTKQHAPIWASLYRTMVIEQCNAANSYRKAVQRNKQRTAQQATIVEGPKSDHNGT